MSGGTPSLGAMLVGTLASIRSATTTSVGSDMGRVSVSRSDKGVGAELHEIRFEERCADLEPLRFQERRGHAAAHEQLVRVAYEPLQHFQFVADLRAAEQRRERSTGVVQHAAQEGDLLLHEQTGERGQLLRDAMRGGVSAMGRAECIVDVAVRETCERRREYGVVRLFAGPEAYVLDEQHVAGLERRCRCASLLTGRVVDVGDGRGNEFREALGDRLQFEISDALTVRTAKVGAEDDGRAAFAQVGDGRQRLTDAHVIRDDRRAALIRHVEINADEGSLTAPVEISNGLLLHTAPIASAIVAQRSNASCATPACVRDSSALRLASVMASSALLRAPTSSRMPRMPMRSSGSITRLK